MNQTFEARHALSHLVLVAGHAVFTGERSSEISDVSKWLVAPYQQRETTDFVTHIRRGVELAAADTRSLLLFSGGATRPFSEPLTEAESYRRVAKLSNWWGHPSVATRTDR